MPMSRLAAGTGDTSWPSTSTVPESAVSKPATMRSAVVFPHPEGPSSATSSPGASRRVSPSRARVVPNDRDRFRRLTVAPEALREAPSAWLPVAWPAFVVIRIPPGLCSGG